MSRLCLLVPDATDPDHVARPAILLASALASGDGSSGSGHEVTLVSVRRGGDRPVEAPGAGVTLAWAEQVDVPGTSGGASPLVPPGSGGKLTLADEARLRRLLADTRPDVVVTTTAALLAMVVQLAPTGCAVLHHLNRVDPQDENARSLLRHFGARADVLTALDGEAAEWVREVLAPVAPDVVVVPHLSPREWQPRAVPADHGEGGLVLAQAPLELDERPFQIVESFAMLASRHPGWRLRVAGRGSRRGALLAAAARLDLHDRVEIVAWHRESRADWARADIGVSAARLGGWHLPVLDAMAAGVPFVAGDSGNGVGALVRHEETGLLTIPNSVASMADAFIRLAEDRALRVRLGEGARRAADARAAEGAGAWGDAVALALERHAGRHGETDVLARPDAEDDLPATLGAASACSAGITPMQARCAVLGLVAEVAERSAPGWFVLPRRWPTAPLVVVPHECRASFLTTLSDARVPDWLSALVPASGARGDRRSSVPGALAWLWAGATPELVLEPWPSDGDGRVNHLAEGARIEIEFWPRRPDGDRVSVRRNDLLASLPPGARVDEVEVDGARVPVPEPLGHPTTWDVTFPIDVVYTWVDGSDPAWDRARTRRQAALLGEAPDRRSAGAARFTDREELRYSLRSLHLFAPWVRRVHLVTAGQRPHWLADHPFVRVVDHADILPPDALPTFNSHAIETALHRIDGLAEHFVYLNDDVMLCRPLGPERFFSPGGSVATFRSRATLGVAREDDAPFRQAAENVRALLLDGFGAVATHEMAHAPHPHRVSVLHEIAERWPEAVGRTAHHAFRDPGDISMLSSLAQQYGLLQGTAHRATLDLTYQSLASPTLRAGLGQLLRTRQTETLCLADGHDYGRPPGWAEREVDRFLRAYYPVAAPWEADAADPARG